MSRNEVIQRPYNINASEENLHPHTWSIRKKIGITIFVSCLTLITTATSTLPLPFLSTLADELQVKSVVETQMFYSIFFLGYALGPFMFGPFSEIYGRRVPLHIASILCWGWNLCCGFSRSDCQFLVFRFLSGIGGGALLTLGPATTGDLWQAAVRGRTIAIYLSLPLIGNVVGPFLGGIMSQRLEWRWAFWGLSCIAALLQLMATLVVAETYYPVILKKHNGQHHREGEPIRRKGMTVVIETCGRGAKLLLGDAHLQVLTLLTAYLWGGLYLVLSSYTSVWESRYHTDSTKAGEYYAAIVIGLVLGNLATAVFGDWSFAVFKRYYGGTEHPAFRMPMMLFGSLMISLGLFWYGWSVQGHLQATMPCMGAAIVMVGVELGTSGVAAYVVDLFPELSASALAVCNVTRGLVGFSFPLAVASMYERMDYGPGSSLIGGLGIGISCLVPTLLLLLDRRKSRSTSTEIQVIENHASDKMANPARVCSSKV